MERKALKRRSCPLGEEPETWVGVALWTEFPKQQCRKHLTQKGGGGGRLELRFTVFRARVTERGSTSRVLRSSVE